MTLSTTTNKTPHIGNGVLTNFSYLFRVDDASHLKVYLDSVEKTTGITVNDVGNDAGGTVDLDVAPAQDVRVTLLRVVPMTQEVDYQPYDAFPSETHEDALDKLTMLSQQLEEVHDRTLSVPPGSDPNVDYTAPEYDAGKAIMWDEGTQTLRNSTDQFDNVVTLANAAKTAAEAAQAAAEAAQSAAETAETNASNAASVAGSHELTASEWATLTGSTVDASEYSAKEYAIGTTVPAGSAKTHRDDAETFRDEVYAFPSTENTWSAPQKYQLSETNPATGAITLSASATPYKLLRMTADLTLTVQDFVAGDASMWIDIHNMATGGTRTVTFVDGQGSGIKWSDGLSDTLLIDDNKFVSVFIRRSAGSQRGGVVYEGDA